MFCDRSACDEKLMRTAIKLPCNNSKASNRRSEDLENNGDLGVGAHEYQEDTEDADEQSDDGWIPHNFEEPDDIDMAIESNIERLRQEALNFNWKELLKDLHSTYLAIIQLASVSPQQEEQLILLMYMVNGVPRLSSAHAPRMPYVYSRWDISQPRDLQKPFSAAVDFYRELEDQTDSVIFKVLKLDEKQFWRPHWHQSKASQDYHRLNTPSIFLKQSEVDKMKAEIRNIELHQKPNDKKDRCTEAHKAADDKCNESSWKFCDDTGLMGCFCRHNAAIYLANINKSGKQRCFPMALLTKLLDNVEPDRQVGILYDIGCSLDKYMVLRGLMDDKRSRLCFGTSVFHSYVHSWGCQLDYNPQLNQRWGSLDGEGLKQMWSYLSPLVSPLRYATQNHRLSAISRQLKYHNTRGIKQLPKWLKKKFQAAICRRVETKKVLLGILETKNPFSRSGNTYTKKFLKAQWEEQRKFKESHTEEKEEHRAKLTEVYKQEAALEALRSCLLEKPSVYLHNAQEVHKLLDKLEETSNNLKKAAERLGRTERPLTDDADEEQKLLLLLWDAKSELYVQAVQLWAERQPLTDSRTIGRRLGTKLSEKIQKAIQSQRGPITKLIANYNT
ncbi:hypothetical protein PTTG_26775 [Puccinia triticina 1-1 BBBD Race 1]|uniref:CxC1-like cysteine cluster associated with KDZ transposases domain-containing protein n=1 Tax=Puccinia triticina (isolate 1-1 / race 1 (BBBD)) TaxID=630390 RepID=A0A180GQR2_PUCT1|nr:hypothetical protein PTTG_26775 [Puccinia triticina 1-1 BBBD Race 1]